MKKLDTENCPFCISRNYVKALADIELGDYKDALLLSEPLYQEDDLFLYPWLAANIRSGISEPVDRYVSTLDLSNPESISVLLDVAYEYKRLGNVTKVAALTRKISSLETINSSTLLEFLYLNGNFNEVVAISDKMDSYDSLGYTLFSFIATAHYKTGSPGEAQKWVQQLENQRGAYQFGSIDYSLAHYYAAIGDKNTAYEYLLRAVKGGVLFVPRKFLNDPVFYKYKDDPEFIAITQYWYQK